MTNPLRRLGELGQSPWIDYIERSFVRDGGLARLVEEDGISGVTSNPAIFQKAIVEHSTYDQAIAALAHRGLTAPEIHEALMVEDIRAAADVLAPIHARTRGHDGFVSLEVSPHLARDTEGTCREGRRLWTLVSRNNLMVKVPATLEGVAAIRHLTAEGININVTLLFDVQRYAAVADAFASGLEDRIARAQPIDRMASVASFFLSRIDALIDPRLDEQEDPRAHRLRGQAALTSARAAYAHFLRGKASARWQRLQSHGARPQRLLWASTGTKDPSYSDVKYVDALVGPDTVTTLPPETLAAFRDHGRAVRQLPDDPDGQSAMLEETLRGFAALGIDLQAASARLESEGLAKFVEPHEATLAALRARIRPA